MSDLRASIAGYLRPLKINDFQPDAAKNNDRDRFDMITSNSPLQREIDFVQLETHFPKIRLSNI